MTFERTALMFRPKTLLASLALGALAGCSQTAATKPQPVQMQTQTPAVTGGDLSSVAARACRAAIARQTNRPVSDVAVYDVAESEAGVGVMATVAGASAPWACQSSKDGKVAGVAYTG
jgi:hypothetical protein